MSYIKHIATRYLNIKKYLYKTPLQYNERLSRLYDSNIYFKREDLQNTRSFKIRGALNMITNLVDNNLLLSGLTCASAGNHAQGVAFLCNNFKINGTIFVPESTPLQKINRINYFGGKYIKIIKLDMDVNSCLNESKDYSIKNNLNFVHPFNDEEIIDGQATVAHEIYTNIKPDIIIAPVGGGGLISGVSKYSKNKDNYVKIVGVEPYGAPSLTESLKYDKIMNINNIDSFVDGASISQLGDITFHLCKKYIDNVLLIENEHLCYDIINSYQDDGIILEPAGALSISALYKLNHIYDLKNKHIVCILSGGNNDLTRYDEIMDLSLKYQNLKHYFIIHTNN